MEILTYICAIPLILWCLIQSIGLAYYQIIGYIRGLVFFEDIIHPLLYVPEI